MSAPQSRNHIRDVRNVSVGGIIGILTRTVRDGEVRNTNIYKYEINHKLYETATDFVTICDAYLHLVGPLPKKHRRRYLRTKRSVRRMENFMRKVHPQPQPYLTIDMASVLVVGAHCEFDLHNKKFTINMDPK